MKLSWIKSGIQERSPIYWADGTNMLDGERGSYQIHKQGGVYRLGGVNSSWVAGAFGTVPEMKKRAQAVENAAVKAFESGYSLTEDVVMLPPGTRRG